jgi:hypothetical protein
MNYEKQILEVLTEVGQDGLSVQKISRHVFNVCNSFFNPISHDDVYRYVSQYLIRNSKGRNSMLETVRRGVYRLNMNSLESQQLMLEFRDDEPMKEENKPSIDHSLSLF